MPHLPVLQDEPPPLLDRLLDLVRRSKTPPPPRAPRPFQPLTSDLPTDAALKQNAEMLKGLFSNAEAHKRSVMLKQKALCNGEATGFQCKHYWRKTIFVESADPSVLKEGEKVRLCRAWGADPELFGEGREGMSPDCTIYEKDDKRPYQPEREEYKPLTPYQIELVQKGACDGMDYEQSLAFLDEAERNKPTATAKEEAPQTVSVDEVLSQENPTP